MLRNRLMDKQSFSMISKFITYALAIFMGVASGILYEAGKFRQKNLYLANTVGNNLTDANDLYSALARYDPTVRARQKRHNLDMILIVDCSEFFDAIHASVDDQEGKYFL
jgi:hypothetical protein